MTLIGVRMITFAVWRWINAKGGMRFAFPPYGLRADQNKGSKVGKPSLFSRY